MLIQESNAQAKVKSLTNEGGKAISRAFYFRVKNSNTIYLQTSILYFSKNSKLNDTLVRTIGDTYVYFRVHPIKLDTLYTLLNDLKLIKYNKH